MILLILIVIILLVLIFILSYQSWKKWNNSIEPVVVEENDQCTINIDTAVSVTNRPCCIVGGYLTASRYVPEYNMVANPVATYYITACEGFCSQGYNSDAGVCINGVGQDDFDNCIELTQPKNNCEGLSMPIAVNGIEFFYPKSATQAGCELTAPC